jgi:hypothetical protein
MGLEFFVPRNVDGRKRGGGLDVDFHLIYIAPAPIFAGLERFHDRVLGEMKMLGGVGVLRRIATADVAAFQAQAQVDPGVAHFQAFLAAVSVRCDFANLIHVRAVHVLPSLS